MSLGKKLLIAAIIIAALALVAVMSIKSAYAQTPEVQLITDPEVLEMIMNGQTPEVSIATTEATTRFWMRTLWDIKDPDEVWVALTSEPNDSVVLTTFINGAIQPLQQLSTNASFQQWELPRSLAQTTHSITAQGAHGWANTQWDWRNSSEGPTFSVVQTTDTWLAIQNRTGQSFFYLAPGQTWRELVPNQTEGFRISSLDYGQVLVRRSTSGANAATLSWDWNGGSNPTQPEAFELRTLVVKFPTDLVVDTSTEFTVTMNLLGVQGDKRAIGGNLHFSDTLTFIGANVTGTTAQHFANFQAFDNGGYVAFSGFSNATPVSQNGGVINFVFRSTYHNATAGLVLTDFTFGPEESGLSISNGLITIKDNLTISGYVESFTGQRDVSTGFVHQGPNGYHYNNYVSASDASFVVNNAQAGDHRLFFYTMDSSADVAAVNLTDVTWAHLCQLEKLDAEDCPVWVLDSYDEDPYDGVDNLDVFDVLYCSSFVLDIPEQDSRAGWHEYQPYPLEFLPLASDQNIIIKSAVVCDVNGSRWMTSSASTNAAPSTVVGQNGQYTVTVTGDQFYGSLVSLDLHGGKISSVQMNNKELTHQNGKFIGLSDWATNEMTIHLTVEETQQVSIISSEINGRLPTDDMPTMPELFIPFAIVSK